MKCQKTQNLLTIAVYGCLTPSQREELTEHWQTCPDCDAKYQKLAPLMDLRSKTDTIPEPDLERSWTVISDRVLSRHRSFAQLPMRKWALAACSLLAVFVLGYFAGKKVLSPGPVGLTLSSEVAAADSFTSFSDCVDSLRPVLVSFLNRDDVETPEAFQLLEQQLISDILARTRLLKILTEGSADDSLLELLQDMEFILTSLRNLDPEDHDSARHLAGLIREKKVSLRLQEFSSARSTF